MNLSDEQKSCLIHLHRDLDYFEDDEGGYEEDDESGYESEHDRRAILAPYQNRHGYFKVLWTVTENSRVKNPRNWWYDPKTGFYRKHGRISECPPTEQTEGWTAIDYEVAHYHNLLEANEYFDELHELQAWFGNAFQNDRKDKDGYIGAIILHLVKMLWESINFVA